MKYLTLLITPLFVFASGETLTPNEHTKEDVQKIKLTHTGNIMFYKVQTQSYSIEINAMDGSVIDKNNNIKDIKK